MELGTVLNFNTERGFGFVRRDHGGENVFLHIHALPPGVVPTVGDRVRMEVAVLERGLRATAAEMVGVVSER